MSGNRRLIFSLLVLLCSVPVCAGPALAQTPANIVECIRATAGPAVAQIVYQFQLADGTKDEARGSGFVIKGDGYIITAAHVLRPPPVYTSSVVTSTIKVKLGSLFATEYPASLITKIDDLDIALIKMPMLNAGWPKVQIHYGAGEDSMPWLYASGFPGTSDLTGAGPGKVTSPNAVVDGKPTAWWQTDIPLNPGMSGGPVFNSFGEVAGIAAAIKGQAGGSITYVIPISSALTLIPLAGVTEYTPSPCSDDGKSMVMDFIKGAVEGQYEKDRISDYLYQTILGQTDANRRYPQLSRLGKIRDFEVAHKQGVPQGTWFTIKVQHDNGQSTWVIGYNRQKKWIDVASFQVVGP
ncbi:serine protease [Rhizobium sp. UGM030330-04]|uniref:S1 family peptidase n=1 Tax=Rhizobium sp. UGM030330-04 TaxID=1378077 RepID=UPI000D9D0FDD|nr:serine protease [Rhizobium sp. UGM030330-04]PYG53719.1 trypsin-like peptidase [Rhizobium sp. UGM030330-04]